MSTKTMSGTAAEIAPLVDRLMRRMHAGIHVRATKVDTDRIGPVGGMVLFTIAEFEPVPIQKLGQMVARDKSQMTRIVNMLEAKGLALGQASQTDARVRLVTLTEKGRDRLQAFQAILTDVADQTLAALEPGERAQLHRLLAKALPDAV